MITDIADEDLVLRPATPADLDLLRHWDRQPHVIAGKGEEDWQWETELARSPAWREQLIAESGGDPVGFLQIIDPALEQGHYWGDIANGLRAIDIWIGEPGLTGRGIGSRMLVAAIGRCFADVSVTGILVDPLPGNIRAHRFYERHGFRFAGPAILDGERCFVYRLDREDFTPAR